MLGNGRGKARADRKGNTRATKHWRCTILSSGEQSIEDKLRSEGKRIRAGQAVRLIDIPADAGFGMGMFEKLHEYTMPKAFADALRNETATHYGHAAVEFIRKLIAMYGNLDTIHQAVSQTAKVLAGPETSEQMQRVSTRFALCTVAGELAIVLGILPWQSGSAETAVRTCFEAWLANRGGEGATEDMQLIQQVMFFFEQHGESRFSPLTPDGNPLLSSGVHPNRAGFKEMKDDCTYYYVLPESFRGEVCKGFNPIQAARLLRDMGILIPGDENHLMAKPPRSLPGWGRKRVYVLSFDASEEATKTP